MTALYIIGTAMALTLGTWVSVRLWHLAKKEQEALLQKAYARRRR